MAVLIINRSESRCSECPGSSVRWEGATAHTESLGGWSGKPVEPCGQTYTAVSSDYAGMEAVIRGLRPDLPWQPSLGDVVPTPPAMPPASFVEKLARATGIFDPSTIVDPPAPRD